MPWLRDLTAPRVTPVEVVSPPDAPAIPRGAPLRIVSWNLQFCGSRRHRFFYDGGDAVFVPADDQQRTLDDVERVLRELDADVVLLQEVDRGSDRTDRVDQHAALVDRLGVRCHASTPYHRVPWVPVPVRRPLGRVDMHLSVLSRYRLSRATRTQLALLREPWWRRLFNLRRALLDVRLPIEGGGELAALDAHLSAFSRGDGTLERQIATLVGRAADTPRWVLAGDLNCLPPGDDPSRLGADAAQYAEAESPVTPLVRRFYVFGAASPPDPAWRTYLPPGGAAPDRQIDYVACGHDLVPGPARVVQELGVSDHLPVLVTVTVP
ncbi:MAG TPA: endonuclease/exonuclease/phosphatase family protein [Myxococcota bacterium]|nr:endonuclease/exonuclease/phosphatase family protein [Myxococcota bacterium]